MIKKRELRNKITTVSMRPSIYKKLQMISFIKSQPINSMINEALEKYVLEHQNEVNEYITLYPEDN